MPKLRPVNWKTLARVFELDGFRHDRTRGSHYYMKKDGVLRTLCIPMYKEVEVFIIKSNMRSAGMTRKRYFELLSQV